MYGTYALAYEGTVFLLQGTLLLILLANLIATVRPYREKFALYNYVDTVMISALAVLYILAVLGILYREQFNAYFRLEVHIPNYICDHCTGTPHAYNSCCTEEAPLEKKLHKLITYCL